MAKDVLINVTGHRHEGSVVPHGSIINVPDSVATMLENRGIATLVDAKKTTAANQSVVKEEVVTHGK